MSKIAQLAAIGGFLIILIVDVAHAFDPIALQQLKKTKSCESCDLVEADLNGLDLTGANLVDSDLTSANLSHANLTNADLNGANLVGADLSHANFDRSSLGGALLNRADLSHAQLTNLKLHFTKMDGAIFTSADFKGTSFVAPSLVGANFDNADLYNVIFFGGNLKDASLQNANLVRSDFIDVDFRGAKIINADLTNATMHGSDLTGAGFNPISLPRLGTMAQVKGIADLDMFHSQPGVVALRKAFKESGMRHQERALTYALKKAEWKGMRCVECSNTISWHIEHSVNYVLFDLTSDWGMSPGRPLLIIFGLTLVLALFYLLAIVRPQRPETGIWLVWAKERIINSEQSFSPQKLTLMQPQSVSALACRITTVWKAPLWALYFSILSAFHVGWRELNVGDWIARINPGEFTLRATGWVKVVAGLQSLFSVYLLALSILTYFGRPFE